MIKHVDSMLVDWSEWVLRQQSGGLGYSRRTPIHRMMIEGYTEHPQYGPNNPAYTLPRSVRDIDRVIRRLPDPWLSLIELHYFTQRKNRKGHHYRLVDRLHHIIEGGLIMQQ